MNWLRRIIDWIRGGRYKPPGPPDPEPPPPDENSLAVELLKGMNAERARVSGAPLAMAAALGRAAQKHADWMARTGSLSHDAPGSSLVSRVQAEGYSWRVLSETIAKGQRTPAEAVQAWMASMGHRAAILDPRHMEVGYGHTRDSQGEDYWCAVFASPG
jgi:uncharacterized protein YkwD